MPHNCQLPRTPLVEVSFNQLRPGPAFPRITRPAVPGFAGEMPPKGGSKPKPGLETPDAKGEAQPFHCMPFLEAIRYGIEVPFQWQVPIDVMSFDGQNIKVEGDFATYTKNAQSVSQFAKGHYGVNSHLQCQMPPGWGGLILPHARWFDDPYGSGLPHIIPGLVEFDWWPRYFFVVCKAPPPGIVHRFRPNEPWFQIIPIPLRCGFITKDMNEEEKRIWNEHEKIVSTGYNTLSTRNWRTPSGKTFGNVYKVLAAEMMKNGEIDWDKHSQLVYAEANFNKEEAVAKVQEQL